MPLQEKPSAHLEQIRMRACQDSVRVYPRARKDFADLQRLSNQTLPSCTAQQPSLTVPKILKKGELRTME